MTETEFETRLTQVSDEKLMKMLEASRQAGPAVALKMILAEGNLRGLQGLEETMSRIKPGVDASIDESLEADMVQAATQAVGYAGGSSSEEITPQNGGIPNDLPPGTADWLDEEAKSTKGAMFMKVMLFLGGLGALIFGAYKFIHRG